MTNREIQTAALLIRYLLFGILRRGRLARGPHYEVGRFLMPHNLGPAMQSEV